MQVYIVQETHGGIPDDPEVFLNESDADDRYLELVNKALGTDYDCVQVAYQAFWAEENYSCTDDYEVRYYITEVKE